MKPLKTGIPAANDTERKKEEMKNRVLAISLAVVLCIGLLAGCGGSGGSQGGGQATTAGNSTNTDLLAQNDNITDKARAGQSDYQREQITLAFTSATSLTPWGTSNNTPGNWEVYECLYESDPEGNLFPVLADERKGGNNPAGVMGYDHEEGTNVYRVYIWDYIKDHAGRDITADDVVFTYTHQYEKEVTSGWGVFEKAEKVDDYTIDFTFTRELTGLGEFEQIFTFCYIVDEETYNNSPSNLLDEMIGTGPYAMLGYTPGSQLTLVAYPNYWQTDENYIHQSQKQNVKKIVFKFINEAATRIMSFKSGDIDLSDDIESVNTADFKDGAAYGDKYNVWSYAAGLIYSLWLNCSEDSICNNPDMRRAIYYAIDIDGLVALLGGTDQRIDTWGNDSNVDYFPALAEIESYNSWKGSQDERKKIVDEYLQKAGYNGEQLMFIYQSDQENVVSIVCNMLDLYGINVTTKGTDHAGQESVMADTTAWDINYGQWGGNYLVQKWAHAYDWANTTTGDHTPNYIYDQEWQDLLTEVQTLAGHTEENMLKWMQMLYDNAYGMNLYNGTKNIIYPEDMTYLYRNSKYIILPGACEYAAPEN